MPVIAHYLAIVLGAIAFLSIVYVLAHDFIVRVWNGITTPDPEMERRMKIVTVEFSPDAFPVLGVHKESNTGTAPVSSVSSEVTQAEALTVVAPYASRVIELGDENGKQNLWLCTLCLN